MSTGDSAPPPPPIDEGAVRRFLFYTLSLPERAVRSTVGVAAGAARETSALLLPRAFRNSRTYRIFVQQTLDFLAQDVGGVARTAGATADPAVSGPQPIENFVARKAAGNFVEMASLLTLHVSPLTLLAVVSDVAYGSSAFLRELAAELKQQGVIDQDSTIDRVDDLLSAVAAASAQTATALDTPPLSISGLRQTVEQTRDALRGINPADVLPQAELQRMWNEMRQVAQREDVSLLAVSGAMTLQVLDRVAAVGRGALSSVKVAGTLLDRAVVSHYRDALHNVQQRGLWNAVSQASAPYVDAVWRNFHAGRGTLTHDVVSGRWLGRLGRSVWSWLRRRRRADPAAQAPSPPAAPGAHWRADSAARSAQDPAGSPAPAAQSPGESGAASASQAMQTHACQPQPADAVPPESAPPLRP
jgi:hypothetical protein